MNRTCKALWSLGLSVVLSVLMGVSVNAQDNKPHSVLEGTWILDSVQVKETIAGNVVQKTVLPGDDCKFNNQWMWRFTLHDNNKASYTKAGEHTVSEVPYLIKDANGNHVTLIIDGVPDYKILNTQLLSDNSMLINHSFVTGFNLQDIEVVWKMYYHKSN